MNVPRIKIPQHWKTTTVLYWKNFKTGWFHLWKNFKTDWFHFWKNWHYVKYYYYNSPRHLKKTRKYHRKLRALKKTATCDILTTYSNKNEADQMEFYKQLSKYYDILFPLNIQSVTFIKERLTEGKILDLAAGTGNHALALAKLGFSVTATDLDENMIKAIEEKAIKDDVCISAIQLAMEQLEEIMDNRFSTIICLGNSLVHLNNINALTKALSDIHNLLSHDGKLFIQIVNYDRVLKEGITELPYINREKEQVSFRRSYLYKDQGIIFKGVLSVGEEILENEVSLLPITSQQLVELLAKVGFKSINLFGSFKGEPFDLNSPATIVEASKE
jgi:glycine/sarcosine N-methyltransferase